MSAGRACLVRALKGLKGFSTMQVGPVLFPTPQVLKARYRPLLPDGNCQGPYPKLGMGQRQHGELRTWAASSPGPGHGSARAKRLVFPGLAVLGWPAPRVPPGCGGGCSRTLSPSRTSLLLRLKLGRTNHSSRSPFDPN